MEQECDEYSEGSLSKIMCIKKLSSDNFSLKKHSCLSKLKFTRILVTLFAKFITSYIYFLFF